MHLFRHRQPHLRPPAQEVAMTRAAVGEAPAGASEALGSQPLAATMVATAVRENARTKAVTMAAARADLFRAGHHSNR